MTVTFASRVFFCLESEPFHVIPKSASLDGRVERDVTLNTRGELLNRIG